MGDICVIGGVQQKPALDNVLFKVDWSDFLQTGLGRHVPIVDRIASSSWSISPASPQASATITGSDFDETLGVTWMTLDGGADGDMIWLDNTIETIGASVNGKSTPAQRATRQIRVRIKSC